MNYTEAKKICIINFLKTKGNTPTKNSTKDTWFLSPFRDEKTPSFKVDNTKNIWYDFGEGAGGTILDLVCKLHNCEAKQALQILSGNSFSFHKPKKMISVTKSYTILKTQQVLNKNLKEYLKSRKLNISFVSKYCCEVHYNFGETKQYYAIGFKNDSNGYELRNKYFKGCLGKKDITTITYNTDSVCVFESWSDFISYLCLQENKIKESYIILNSTSMLNKAFEKMKNYNIVKVFFDNDNGGTKAFNKIKYSDLDNVIDMRKHYENYKDLNEYLINKKSKD